MPRMIQSPFDAVITPSRVGISSASWSPGPSQKRTSAPAACANGLPYAAGLDRSNGPLDVAGQVHTVPASVPALEHLFQVGQVRPQDRRCLQTLLEVASELGNIE
jgi:hypothetical protein